MQPQFFHNEYQTLSRQRSKPLTESNIQRCERMCSLRTWTPKSSVLVNLVLLHPRKLCCWSLYMSSNEKLPWTQNNKYLCKSYLKVCQNWKAAKKLHSLTQPTQYWSPRLGWSLLYFVVDSVCLSVHLSVCHKLQSDSSFCFSMESSHFLAVSYPWPPLQNVVLRFLI